MPHAPDAQQFAGARRRAASLPRIGELLASAITRRPSGHAGRRVLGAVFLLVVLLPLHWTNQLFLWLDLILFPGLRQVPIKQPLFIVGPPRSGTTLLHRLLAADSRQFTTFPLWELLFAPAICQKYFFLSLYRLDGWIGHPLFAAVCWLERVLARGHDGIHNTSLQLPEEDFLLLLPRRACFLLILAFPYCEALWQLGYFDQSYPAAARRRLLVPYRRLLQRHLYVRGTHRTLVSKNASFSSWIGSLRDVFPDARFIGLWRRPDQTVPSQLSSIRGGLRLFGNDVEDPELVERFVNLMAFYHAHVTGTLSELPASRARIVRYTDLCDRPDEIVLHARTQLGYPVSHDGRQKIQTAADRAGHYRSGHRYALSEFHLTDDDIRRRFADPAIDWLDVSTCLRTRPSSASKNDRHVNEPAHVT